MTSITDSGGAALPMRVGVIGSGLIGTSIALAAARVGCHVTTWDLDIDRAALAAGRGGFASAPTMGEAVHDADIVVVATPIPAIAATVAQVLGSVKMPLVAAVGVLAASADLARYVPGHPMGGSERSGPDHASASVVDGIVWVVTPTALSDPGAVDGLEGWVARIGARPVRMDPVRHDRLVAFVSHLPQVASTALMSLAATEEADEPEILLLAAGGFRDLTRLAASNPALWSDILLSNREAIGAALDLYVARLLALREAIVGERGDDVEATFDQAKAARLRLAT